MGWSEGDAMMMRCKKHPKHRQSAGVCSLCLIDRLSDLAAANNAKANGQQAASYSSSDASTSYSTVSSPSSPSKSMFFSGPVLGGRAPMFRSKSVAVAVERPAPPGKERRRRSGTGFWSKLMRVGTYKRRKAQAPAASSALVGVRN